MKLHQKQKINTLLNNLPLDRKAGSLLLCLYSYLCRIEEFRQRRPLRSVFSVIKVALNYQEDKLHKSFNITDEEIESFLQNYPKIDTHFKSLVESLDEIVDYKFNHESTEAKLLNDFFEAASYTDPAVFNVYCENKFTKALIDYLCKDKSDATLYFTDNAMLSAESYAQNDLNIKTTSIVNCFSHYDTALSPFVLKVLRALFFSLNENKVPPTECFSPGIKMSAGFAFSQKFYLSDPSFLTELNHNYREFINKVDGRFSLFIPVGMTFSNNIEIKEFRKALIEYGYLDKVVRLPKYFVNNIDVSPVALVFDKKKTTNTIDFINLDYKEAISAKESSRHHYVLSDDAIAELNKALNGENSSICKKVGIDELAKLSYRLDAATQVTGSLQEHALDILNAATISLKDVATTYRAQACSKLCDEDDIEKESWCELNLADITETGIVTEIAKRIEIEMGHPQVKRNKLKSGDIVLSVKGNVGKVGILRENADNFIAGQCFAIIRSTDPAKYPPEAIFLQLKSDAIQDYIKAKTSGNTIKVLQSDMLKKIPLFELTEDQKANAVSKVQELDEIENQLALLKKQIKTIVSDKL